MKLREAMQKLHQTDHFAAEMEKAMTFTKDPGAQFGGQRPSRKPGRRGPVPQWTDNVDASVTEDVARKLRRAASRRNISLAALLRQIFDSWLKANEEAWQ